MNNTNIMVNAKTQLYIGGRLARYVGTRKDGSEYDIISTKVMVEKNGRREYHDVVFDPVAWNAIASAASAFDKVEITGDLEVPAKGEPGAYEVTRRDGTTYMVGRLTHPVPTGLVKSPFPAGHLPLADDLSIVDKRENRLLD